MNIALSNLEQTRLLGQILGQNLAPGTVLLLEGELGAGKTSLVQGLGAALGITDAIVSPTFALIHEYPEGRIPLYHFDLYRLNPAEANELHLEIYWQAAEIPLGIVAIEWPDRLVSWPERHLGITLTYAADGRCAHIRPQEDQDKDWLMLQNHLKRCFQLKRGEH